MSKELKKCVVCGNKIITSVKYSKRKYCSEECKFKGKHSELISSTYFDKVYLAGFFDGEGCIEISFLKKTQYYCLRLSISQKRKKVLEWIKKRYGGSLYLTKNGTIWNWHNNSTLAEKCLLDIAPFLIVKKEEAQIAIDFLNTINRALGSEKISQNIIELRQYLRQKLMNSRGSNIKAA